ncbi:MAG: hypothetical protein GQ574_09785 [Crocinitomix sp.]|nr:hypothetical protein [Crocinitomix sp.]
MNNKTLTRLLALVLCLGSFTIACKKGENDPALSLKTRNNRLKGAWELVKLDEQREKSGEGLSLGEAYTYEYSSSRTIEDGVENYKRTSVSLFEGDEPSPLDCTYVRNIYQERDFQKNGIFTQFSIIENDTNTSYIEWYWLDQEKKKSGLLLNGTLFQVDRLAKDELILKRDVVEYVEADTSPGFSYVSSDIYSYTALYKKK